VEILKTYSIVKERAGTLENRFNVFSLLYQCCLGVVMVPNERRE